MKGYLATGYSGYSKPERLRHPDSGRRQLAAERDHGFRERIDTPMQMSWSASWRPRHGWRKMLLVAR